MRTSAPPSAILFRLIVAADLFVDGARAAQFHFLIGNTRLEMFDRTLPPLLIVGLGWLQIGLAILLAVGFLTRPIALLAAILPLLAGLGAYERLHSLQAASRLDILLHTWAIVLTCIFLTLRSGGRLSIDGLLSLRLNRPKFRRNSPHR